MDNLNLNSVNEKTPPEQVYEAITLNAARLFTKDAKTHVEVARANTTIQMIGFMTIAGNSEGKVH